MITADLSKLELSEFTGKNRPTQHCRATFPILEAVGSEDTAMVYFELDEGKNLGQHTDSAEEILLILEGKVEVKIGDERRIVNAGSIALVPTMVPHDLKNVGQGKVRVAGIFGRNNITATFDIPWAELNSNVVSTAEMTKQTAQA
ncbi:MAG TPA: cupin domain-containing protein [candidate division Zixibacteria bacterium]|nr:cupin domain-containing protein [candidate division Zixibacteria bacterium]